MYMEAHKCEPGLCIPEDNIPLTDEYYENAKYNYSGLSIKRTKREQKFKPKNIPVPDPAPKEYFTKYHDNIKSGFRDMNKSFHDQVVYDVTLNIKEKVKKHRKKAKTNHICLCEPEPETKSEKNFFHDKFKVGLESVKKSIHKSRLNIGKVVSYASVKIHSIRKANSKSQVICLCDSESPLSPPGIYKHIKKSLQDLRNVASGLSLNKLSKKSKHKQEAKHIDYSYEPTEQVYYRQHDFYSKPVSAERRVTKFSARTNGLNIHIEPAILSRKSAKISRGTICECDKKTKKVAILCKCDKRDKKLLRVAEKTKTEPDSSIFSCINTHGKPFPKECEASIITRDEKLTKSKKMKKKAPTKHAVRIGSSFSFNIEFYKENQGAKGDEINTLSSMKSQVDKKAQYRVKQRKEPSQNKSIQSEQKRRRESSTCHDLRRCFCTLALKDDQNQVQPKEESFVINFKKKIKSNKCKCEIHPTKNSVSSGEQTDGKVSLSQKSFACDSFFDSIEKSEARIFKRRIRKKHYPDLPTGTSTPKSVTKYSINRQCDCKCGIGLKKNSESSGEQTDGKVSFSQKSFACDSFFDSIEKSEAKILKNRFRKKKYPGFHRHTTGTSTPISVTKYSVTSQCDSSKKLPRSVTDSNAHTNISKLEPQVKRTFGRNVVKIRSSFSFDIQFYKEGDSTYDKVVQFKTNEHKRNKNHKESRRKKKTTSTDSSSRLVTKNFLKNCLCLSEYTNSTICTKNKATKTKSTKRFPKNLREYDITRTSQIVVNKSPPLCQLDECEPDCKIRKNLEHLQHDIKNKGVCTKSHQKSASNNTVKFISDASSSKRQMLKHRRKINSSQFNPTSNEEEGSPNRQAVRIGSSFSFNVEFYKDMISEKQDKQNNYVSLTKRDQRATNITKYKSKDEKTKPFDVPPRCEEKSTEVNKTNDVQKKSFLNKCLCTLKLFMARNDMIHQSNEQNEISKTQKSRLCQCEISNSSHQSILDTKSSKFRSSGTSKSYKRYQNLQARSSGTSKSYKTHQKLQPRSNGTSKSYIKNQNLLVDLGDQKTSKRRLDTFSNKRKNHPSTSSKNIVRIGSSFSFNLEFYKEKGDYSELNHMEPVETGQTKRVNKEENVDKKVIGKGKPFQNIRNRKCNKATVTETPSKEARNSGISTPVMMRCFCTRKYNKNRCEHQKSRTKDKSITVKESKRAYNKRILASCECEKSTHTKYLKQRDKDSYISLGSDRKNSVRYGKYNKCRCPVVSKKGRVSNLGLMLKHCLCRLQNQNKDNITEKRIPKFEKDTQLNMAPLLFDPYLCEKSVMVNKKQRKVKSVLDMKKPSMKAKKVQSNFREASTKIKSEQSVNKEVPKQKHRLQKLSSKKAVRLGSAFKFDVEFYKQFRSLEDRGSINYKQLRRNQQELSYNEEPIETISTKKNHDTKLHGPCFHKHREYQVGYLTSEIPDNLTTHTPFRQELQVCYMEIPKQPLVKSPAIVNQVIIEGNPYRNIHGKSNLIKKRRKTIYPRRKKHVKFAISNTLSKVTSSRLFRKKNTNTSENASSNRKFSQTTNIQLKKRHRSCTCNNNNTQSTVNQKTAKRKSVRTYGSQVDTKNFPNAKKYEDDNKPLTRFKKRKYIKRLRSKRLKKQGGHLEGLQDSQDKTNFHEKLDSEKVTQRKGKKQNVEIHEDQNFKSNLEVIKPYSKRNFSKTKSRNCISKKCAFKYANTYSESSKSKSKGSLKPYKSYNRLLRFNKDTKGCTNINTVKGDTNLAKSESKKKDTEEAQDRSLNSEGILKRKKRNLQLQSCHLDGCKYKDESERKARPWSREGDTQGEEQNKNEQICVPTKYENENFKLNLDVIKPYSKKNFNKIKSRNCLNQKCAVKYANKYGESSKSKSKGSLKANKSYYGLLYARQTLAKLQNRFTKDTKVCNDNCTTKIKTNLSKKPNKEKEIVQSQDEKSISGLSLKRNKSYYGLLYARKTLAKLRENIQRTTSMCNEMCIGKGNLTKSRAKDINYEQKNTVPSYRKKQEITTIETTHRLKGVLEAITMFKNCCKLKTKDEKEFRCETEDDYKEDIIPKREDEIKKDVKNNIKGKGAKGDGDKDDVKGTKKGKDEKGDKDKEEVKGKKKGKDEKGVGDKKDDVKGTKKGKDKKGDEDKKDVKRKKKGKDKKDDKAVKKPPCICGSKICKSVTKAKKKQVTSKSLPPCICGSKECKKQLKLVHDKQGLICECGRPGKQKNIIEIAKKKKQEDLKRKLQESKTKKKRKAWKKQISTSKKLSEYECCQMINQIKEMREERRLAKQYDQTSDTMLILESVLDLAKMATNLLWHTAGSSVNVMKDPKGSFEKIKREPFKVHRMCFSKEFHKTGRQIVGKLKALSVTKSAVKVLESNPVTHYLFHAFDKDSKKRLKKQKQVRKRKERMDFECSPYMASLRKRPYLWFYDKCPTFYPHCVNGILLARQFMDLVLFLLAVAVWSPCILTMEVCRALMCCFLCTG